MATDITKECNEIRFLADELKIVAQLKNPDPNHPLSKYPIVHTPAELDARELDALRQLAPLAIGLVETLHDSDVTLTTYRPKVAKAGK